MANKKDENKPVKKKHGGGGKNSPVIGDNGLMLEAGDNTKYLSLGMELFKLPSIDLREPEQVQNRLSEFFEIHARYDMKPTVAGMGMSLGLDRRRLWEIKTGNYHTSKALESLPTRSTESIKKAYEYMEILWENYMQNGKINPVSGIFLGKNNFGYQDKTEYVVTPNTNSDSDYSTEDIRKRYLSNSQEQLLEGGSTLEDNNSEG